MAAGLDPTYNELVGGSVAPATGGSVALLSTGSNKRAASSGDASSAPGSNATQTAPADSGSFVVGGLTFIVLLVLIMWLAHKFGGVEGNFSNIKGSFHDILFVALVAIAGIPLIKLGTGQLAAMNVPGASHLDTWAKAA